MHEVEREVYDYFDDDDDMNEVRRLELERKEERIRELKHQQRKRREQEKDSERRNRRSSAVDEDDDEEVRIGVESRRRPAVEEWDRNKGTRTSLADGKQHSVKTVGIGDLRVPNEPRSDRESERLLQSGKPLDVICVDGSKSADKALAYALKRLPTNHTFLLLHGSYSPSSTGLHPRENKESAALESRYLDLCEEQGRKCKFVNFSFTDNRNFGEKVCQYEKYQNVESIVMGKRGYVSDFRRVLMGSSTQSVLNACSMPITIVNEKEKRKEEQEIR
jgi:hypothetical protein